MSPKIKLTFWVISLTLISLACGTINIGIVENEGADSAAPTQAQQPASEGTAPSEPTSQPATDSAPAEPATQDFSYLWIEYRDPAYGYRVALPAHWIVNPTPTEGYDGAMTTTSYDEAYFMAHATKGWWNDNIIPAGAIKMDFAGMPDPNPKLDLAAAIDEMYSQSDTTVVLATEPASYNGHEALLVTTANAYNQEETFTSVAFRLPNDKILLVTAFWGNAFSSPDVQAILNSFAFEGEPVILPTIAPQPPLNDTSTEAEIPFEGGTPAQAIGWLGHIVGLPAGGKYDDFVLLSPAGAGEFGICGSTPEIESELQFLRDKEGVDEYVHLWGQFTCGVADYNNCRLTVEKIHREGYIEESAEGWVGVITANIFNGGVSHIFQLAGDVPMWYSIHASQDPALQAQIESLRDTGAVVQVWGTLMVGVPDVNGLRIEPARLEVLETGGKQAPLPGADLPAGWLAYANDRFGYSLQYPGKAQLEEHGPDGGIPTNEIPEGMTVDVYQQYLMKIYPALCVTIQFGQGYVNISAPPNAGARYTPCGITGVGQGEVTSKTEQVSVGGQVYTADGMEFVGSGGLNDHMETFSIELEDGTQIRYGGGSTSEASYEDYLAGTKDFLLQILASYRPMVKRVYYSAAAAPEAASDGQVCEPGFFGDLDELVDMLIYNLEIGNDRALAPTMGNPFAMNYWRSEGLSLSRDEAIATLRGGLFPIGQITSTRDEAQFPALDGTPLSSLWPPEVEIAAQVYSTGWGGDGNGAAILAIARCADGTYYWYGLLYALQGFE